MRVDPADVWEARLRDAPAASAAEAILASLLGYRDSHMLHADDVAQLASALEAWGTLVLGGARPDGSPFVPPTSDERASAAASLVAIAFAERERATAVAAMTAHANANARATGLAPPSDSSPPTAHEIEVLQMVAGERPWAPWGAWIGACMEFLQEGGYLTCGPTLTARITAKGLEVLAALKASQHTGAPDA